MFEKFLRDAQKFNFFVSFFYFQHPFYAKKAHSTFWHPKNSFSVNFYDINLLAIGIKYALAHVKSMMNKNNKINGFSVSKLTITDNTQKTANINMHGMINFDNFVVPIVNAFPMEENTSFFFVNAM